MTKRKIKKKFKYLTLLFLCVGILVAFFFYQNHTNLNSNNSNNNNNNEIKEEFVDPIKKYHAKLIATGDGLLHSTVYNAAYNKEQDKYDFSNMLVYTKELLKDYDIKYYNQETIFDDDKVYGGYPRFNSPSDFGLDMINAGFNLVSLATNHSLDMGGTSAKKHASWWEGQNNILAHGMASSTEKRNNYQIMEANGITYTMLSYTYGTNGLGTSDINNEPFIVNLYDEETIKNDIAQVRDKVDVLIVAMHWGNEYNQTPSSIQKEQANFLASHGVDIILGTHSHCIQPWEKIDDTIVFYSFGNFISNQMAAEQAIVRKLGVIGMFGTLDITKTVDTINNTEEIAIDNIGADLHYTYRFYNNSINKYDYLVIPFSKMEEKYLKNYQTTYDEFSKVLKMYDENIIIAPLPN